MVTIYKKLIGKTFTVVENKDDDELIFKNEEEGFRFYHEQDCCENVRIEDIEGNLNDLAGSPILQAEEVSDESYETAHKPKDNYIESFTWTFYKFATQKGYVVVRWLGTSNGCYSESVDFAKLPTRFLNKS